MIAWAEQNTILAWKKKKLLGRIKGMSIIMNFPLRLFWRAEFSSVTEDFFCNTDQACSVSIFKYFSNMQCRESGEGQRKLFPLVLK